MDSIPDATAAKSTGGTAGKTALTVVGVVLVIAATGAAIGIPLCTSLGACAALSTSTTTTSTTTITTTSTSTVTTTTATTTATTPALALGTQNYVVALSGNGYHGIQKVRYHSATNTSTAIRFAYPIVFLNGTTFSGSYVNGAYYALHAGCGNSNGIAGCTGVCKSLNRNYVGITSSCGTGYTGSVTTYVNPDRCVYTSADTVSTPWTDYNLASTCGNPMYYCDCTL